ncbi:hypothetical protein MYA_5040 [Burkholderia sp. KJ006]|nr:hypothetical protein MYA_5040 [Burkholderia sp. KJ006]
MRSISRHSRITCHAGMAPRLHCARPPLPGRPTSGLARERFDGVDAHAVRFGPDCASYVGCGTSRARFTSRANATMASSRSAWTAPRSSASHRPRITLRSTALTAQSAERSAAAATQE